MRAAALTIAALIATLPLLALDPEAAPVRPVHLPWKEAGLTQRQAALHLLNRFAYGPRPGEVEAVMEMGLDRWLERQLAADLPDGRLEERLDDLPALEMPAAELARIYPAPGRVLAEARRQGVIPEEAGLEEEGEGAGEKGAKEEKRAQVIRFARRQGYRPQKELLEQLMAQKLWRAVESENQLAEVMTDFWFNHFNVSLTDNQTRPYLLSYERDAIRPNALESVRDLLGATAQHPAMLLYLDNAQSSAMPGSPTTLDRERDRLRRRRPSEADRKRRGRSQGLNENYARELLELHTLGVDGGYTQKDVVEVARAFTGWSVLPGGPFREDAERRLERARRAGGLGFRVEGELLFRADQHDAGEKVVLGKRLPAGRGMEDGEEVLDLLAKHPATARHLATQLVTRFVSDQPPAALVDRLAQVYLRSGGDVRQMLRSLAGSRELWAPEAVGAKIKSPFELTASALRATAARVNDPRPTVRWIADMGQPLYAAQSPTGYPDRAETWVSTGALLQRMNFGVQLAAGKVAGVKLDPARAIDVLAPFSRDPHLPAEKAVGVILGSPEFQRR